MNHRPRSLILILATGAFLLASQLWGSAALAQDAPDQRASRVDALFAGLNRSPSPGLAVVVVRDGKVILRRGYGLASIEHRVPITPSTVFDLASLSKQFTGLAVAMLASEGKIKLSDDIRKYIPELPDMGHPITIAHLVHHTSGLRDWVGTLSIAGWRPDDPITFRQILAFAYSQRTLNFEPGTEHLYSNTGYNLLAELVQRVTGQTFRAWTDEHIFRPLGMTNTHIRDDYNEVIANRAFGYARAPSDTYRSTPDVITAFGSSSVFSTADDFARWLINFDEAGTGGRAAMSLMRTRGVLKDGTTIPYAFGILHGSYRGLPMFTSSGGWASFNTYDVYFPEQKFGIVVLANGDNPALDAQSAVIKIADIYLEKELAPQASPQTSAPTAPRKADATPASLDEYVGLYRVSADSYMRIERYGMMLLARLPRHGPVPLSPKSDKEFRLESGDGGAAVLFQRDPDGKVTALEYGGQRAPRLNEAEAHPPAQLAEYVGDYDSEELGTSYRVALKAGALEMQHRRRGNIPLKWLWRDEFGGLDAYFGSVEFQRDGAGRVIGLIINGDSRSRNIRFVKRR